MVCRLKKTRLMVATGAALGVGLVFFSYPGGILAAYRDARDMPEMQARLESDKETRRAMDQKAVVLSDRIALKDMLIRELVAGRATLAEVSRRFHELNAAYPTCMHVIRSRYPNVTDDERIALNVIDFARLHDMPADQRIEVEARLGAQFYATFGHENPAPN